MLYFKNNPERIKRNMEKNSTHYLRIHCFLCWTANKQTDIV